MFLQWQDLYEIERPFQIFIDIPKDAKDQRDTNLVFEKVSCKIEDVRDGVHNLSLDGNGFIYRRHATNVTDFTNRMTVDRNYLPEIEKFLKDELDGVDRVFFFDWRVRRPPIGGPSLTQQSLTENNSS